MKVINLTEAQRRKVAKKFVQPVFKIEAQISKIKLIDTLVESINEISSITRVCVRLNRIFDLSHSLKYSFGIGKYWITPKGKLFEVSLVGKRAGLGIISKEQVIERIVVDLKPNFETSQVNFQNEFESFKRTTKI